MQSALNTALTGTVKPGRDRPAPAAFTMEYGTRMLISPATPYAALPIEQQHRITRAMGKLRWWWEQDHSHTIARHLFNIAGAMCSRCLSHVQANGTGEVA